METRLERNWYKIFKWIFKQISNELSEFIGEELQVELNINQIQFPGDEFAGIDAKIKEQQETYKAKEKNNKYTGKSQGFCELEEDYNARKDEYVSENKQRSYYEVDLLQILQATKQTIDNQASGTQTLLKRVIEKQIKEDFKNAEQQMNDYIERFQVLFDSLIKEREIKEEKREEIRALLEKQKAKLNVYLDELSSTRLDLNSWKPVK